MMLGLRGIGDDGDDVTDQPIYITYDPNTVPETSGGTPYVAGSELPYTDIVGQTEPLAPCSSLGPLPCGTTGPVNCDATNGGPTYASCLPASGSGAPASGSSANGIVVVAAIAVFAIFAMEAFK